MKKVLVTLVIAMIFPIISYSQINWVSQNSGTNSQLDGVYFVDENNGWVTGWGQLILHTTNGGATWGLQNTPATSLHSVFFTDLMNGWAAGSSSQIIHTTDGGATWTVQQNLGSQEILQLFFINENMGWAVGGFYDLLSGSYGRVIYNTTDGGNNWNVQYNMTFQAELNSIYFIDSNTGYADGGSGIMKTTNGGSSWFVQQSISGFTLGDIFFTSSTTGYVTGWYTGVPHYTAIFKTTDGGNSWNQTSLGQNEDLTGLYFTSELNGWAVGADYSGSSSLALIYRTTDGGNNWVKQNIPAFNAVSKVFFVNDTKGWAVGSLGTILATESPVPVELNSFTASVENSNVSLNWKTETEKNNSGFTIQRKTEGQLPDGGITDWTNIGFVKGQGTTTEENSYSFTDRDLTSGQYQYRLKQIDLDGSFNYSDAVQVSISVPQNFSLEQNYPNPFNPSTTITYHVPKTGFVTLKVYDVLGHEVTALVNEKKSPGRYSVNFDTSNLQLASGVYIYQLRVDGFITSKKMMLIK